MINCDLETVGFPGAIMHKLHLATDKARLAPKHVSQNEDNSGDEKISWSYYQTATHRQEMGDGPCRKTWQNYSGCRLLEK